MKFEFEKNGKIHCVWGTLKVYGSGRCYYRLFSQGCTVEKLS